MEKHGRALITILLILVLLARLTYIWWISVNQLSVKTLDFHKIELVIIQYRYKPLTIQIKKGDPSLQELVELFKYWWYFERFFPNKIIKNQVADYKVQIYTSNLKQPLEINIFPHSKIYDYIDQIINLSQPKMWGTYHPPSTPFSMLAFTI